MSDDTMTDLKKLLAEAHGEMVLDYLRRLRELSPDEMLEAVERCIFKEDVKAVLTDVLGRFAENPFVFFRIYGKGKHRMKTPDGETIRYSIKKMKNEPRTSKEFLAVLTQYLVSEGTSLYVGMKDVISLQAFILASKRAKRKSTRASFGEV